MPHATHPQSDLDYANVRLRLVGTRLAKLEKAGDGYGGDLDDTDLLLKHGHRSRDAPVFTKPEAATPFELFYDLWFVANLSVFSSVHEITTTSSLISFIGYYVLLWTTWLLTTMYDVRFTADSLLERCCKATHLGVMVGFAEIGTAFEPDDQIKSVFRALSFFLTFSRLMLAIQYGVVAWQVRKYNHGKNPMLLTAAVNLAAAAVYFGISFRYDSGKNSRVYVVWYILGIVEMAAHLLFSQLTEVLTFRGTHLGERMTLLTLIVLGEGAIILAKNVTLVVKDTFIKDPNLSVWSSSLIGIVTASAALIYIIFQLYFDWMHDEHNMSVQHQVWWASLHLPFHITLVLLLEGANQAIIWARVSETVTASLQKVIAVVDKLPDVPTSEQVSDALGNVVKPFLQKYQPADVLETWKAVNETLTDIAELPEYIWTEDNIPDDDKNLVHWTNDLLELCYTMVNAVYNSFGIEAEVEDGEHGAESAEQNEYLQAQALEALDQRFRLVFIYTFSCAGIVLLFLTIMHIIMKRKGWTPFNIFRTAICVSLGLGLSLLSLLTLNTTYTDTFIGSHWMLPVITLCYFFVLVLSHVPHLPLTGWGNRKRGAYTEVEEQKGLRDSYPMSTVPMSQGIDERGHNRRDSQHGASFEDRRSGYVETEAEMAQISEHTRSGHSHRDSYLSAGSRDDEFDDVVDYEQRHGEHRLSLIPANQDYESIHHEH